MPKALAAFCADLHLAERAWTVSENRNITGDSFYSFRQIIDTALKYRVDVVCAGDIMDKVINRDVPVTFLMQQLDRLDKDGLVFYYIIGNHDAGALWPAGHRAARHFDGEMAHLDTVSVFGRDFIPAPLLQTGLTAIPADTDVLVAHQCWSDWCGDTFNPQGSFSDVPSAKVMVTGDLHSYRVTDAVGKTGQKIKVFSPGATCLQAIDEPSEHFFLVLYDDFTWKRVRLNTRHRLRVTFNHPGEIEAFMQALPVKLEQIADYTEGWDEQVRKPLIHVTYASHLSGCYERIVAAVGDKAWTFRRELPPEPTPEVAVRRETLQKRGRAATLSSEMHGFLEQKGWEEAEPDCARLLDSVDPVRETQQMLNEAL
jgi:hypothetical protein